MAVRENGECGRRLAGPADFGALRTDGGGGGAYRFGGTALAIVLLVPRTGSAWHSAFHRFAEVSIGIAVALFMTLAWPERELKPQ
jgi:hypothetical protein